MRRKILLVAMLYGIWPLIIAVGYVFAPLTSSALPGVGRAALAHQLLPGWLLGCLLITSAGAACALGVRLRAVNVWAGGAALVISAGVMASYLWWPWPSDYLTCVAVSVVAGLVAALIGPSLAAALVTLGLGAGRAGGRHVE